MCNGRSYDESPHLATLALNIFMLQTGDWLPNDNFNSGVKVLDATVASSAGRKGPEGGEERGEFRCLLPKRWVVGCDVRIRTQCPFFMPKQRATTPWEHEESPLAALKNINPHAQMVMEKPWLCRLPFMRGSTCDQFMPLDTAVSSCDRIFSKEVPAMSKPYWWSASARLFLTKAEGSINCERRCNQLSAR